MIRKAVIEIGSNSVKLIVVSCLGQNIIKTDLHKMSVERLGERLQENGLLLSHVMERNLKTIGRFLNEAKSASVDDIFIVATNPLREAENASEFIEKVKGTYGFDIAILSQEEEAKLSYLAAYRGLDLGTDPIVVFDIGGGSTEIIRGNGSNVKKVFGLDTGVVKITEAFFKNDPVKELEFEKAINEIKNKLGDLKRVNENDELNLKIDEHRFGDRPQKNKPIIIGIGAAATTFASVFKELEVYDSKEVHGEKILYKEIVRQVELYRKKTVEERKLIKGMPANRADVVLAGSIIVKEIMEIYSAKELLISDMGLRYGVVFNNLKKL